MPRIFLLAACAAAVIAPGLVQAQSYVYDARATTLQGTWSRVSDNLIGGWTITNDRFRDFQQADDFVLTTRTRLTKVTIDLNQFIATAPPAGGFLIEVFPNAATNRPAEVPTFTYTTAAATLDGTFGYGLASSGIFDLPDGGARATWSVDLTGGSIVLDPGTWWISVVPIDLTTGGSRFRVVGNGETEGFRSCRRSGGNDHGNGYAQSPSGTSISPGNWTTNSSLATPHTLSIRIEGASERGACCTPDTMCTDTAMAECVGGTWTPGAVCSANPCQDPLVIGACCAVGGACSMTVSANCAVPGGSWTASGVCSAATCAPLPTGACCSGGAACSIKTYAECSAEFSWKGSVWIANGTCVPSSCPQNFEIEPNDTREDASTVTLAPGDSFSGFQATDSSHPVNVFELGGDRDLWRVSTAARPAGIYRNTLIPAPGNISFPSLQLLDQTDDGVILPPGTEMWGFDGAQVAWYGFGKQEYADVFMAPISSEISGLYTWTLTSTEVTPVEITDPISAGAITISVSSFDVDPDMWLYDANFNAIPGAGNNNVADDVSTAQMTRSVTPGVYYLAVAISQLVNNQPRALDDFAGGPVISSPNMVVALSQDAGDMQLSITDSDNATTDVLLPFDIAQRFQIAWFRLTIGSGAGGVNCCRGVTCNAVASPGACTGSVAGSASIVVGSCGGGSALASCCFADFNHDGAPSIDDLFLYLNAYFVGSPWANVGGDGVAAPTIDDLFLYINAYFTGCT